MKKSKKSEIKIELLEDKISPIIQLPIEKLIPLNDNVNELDEKMFSALTNSIAESGLSRQPILVSPMQDGNYEIISGNHRYESAKLLGWEKVPCIVEEFKDPLLKKATSVKMNLIHGQPNSAKFTQLYNDIAKQYGDDQTKEMMGIADEKLFKQVYLDLKKSLPNKQMQKEFSEKAKDIQSIDTLQNVLNDLLSKYGDTLENSFLIFTYGSKPHVYIELSQKLKLRLNKIIEKITTFELNMTEYMEFLFQYSDTVFKKRYNIQKEVIEDVLVEDELANNLVLEDKPVYKKHKRGEKE